MQLDAAGALVPTFTFSLPVRGTAGIAASSGAAYLAGSADTGFAAAAAALDSTCGTAAAPCSFDHPDAFLLKIGGASAGLSLTLSASPDPVIVGHQATFTAVATNAGPQTATNVTISFTMPAGATLVSAAVTGGGSCAGAGPIVCSVASLSNGSSATATMIVMAVDGVLATNATVQGAEPSRPLTSR